MLQKYKTLFFSTVNTLRNYLNPKASEIVPPSVTLFSEDRPEIQISVIMRIREDGALEVAGQDTGKLVLELQGKNGYEYYLVVQREEKNSLKKKLEVEDQQIQSDADLLQWFQLNYSKNEAFSEITALLKKLKVKHEVSFW